MGADPYTGEPGSQPERAAQQHIAQRRRGATMVQGAMAPAAGGAANIVCVRISGEQRREHSTWPLLGLKANIPAACLSVRPGLS